MKEFEELNYISNIDRAVIYHTANFDQLSGETKAVLEPQLVEAAAQAFRREITLEFNHDVASHVRGGDLMVVIVDQKVEGFGLLQHFPCEDGVYISGIVKSKRAPSYVIEQVISSYLDIKDPRIVTVRTQNDRVVEIMANLCKEVVAMDRPAGIEDLEILQKMGLIKPEVTKYLLLRRYFGGVPMIIGERRRSLNTQVRELTDRLNYDQGDACYLIGYR